MRILLLISAALLFVAPAMAAVSTYGWEDGGTVLGMYGVSVPPMYAYNVVAPDPVNSGLASLKLVDNEASGTPEGHVAWIRGLSDGQTVTGTFWAYDITSAAPSCRIWAHWNDDPNDVTVRSGSASGNSAYSGPSGWGTLSYTWTVSGGHTGLVIEVRTYSNPGDTVWVDDIEVIHPDGTTCTFPEGMSPVEESTWAGIKALYR